MGCVYTVNDKLLTEEEFKQFLSQGGLDSFIGDGSVDLTKIKFEPQKSGIKKKLVREETKQKVDWEKVSDSDMHKFGEAWYKGNPDRVQDVINRILSDKAGVLEPIEVAGLIYYKATLDKKINDAYAEKNALVEKGEGTDVVNQRIAKLNEDLFNFEVVSLITAQQQSLAFRLRQGLRDSNTFDLAKEINKYRANNKGVIPPKVEARFNEIDAELKEMKANMDKLEAENEKLKEQELVDSIVESVDNEKKPKTKERAKDKINKLADKVERKLKSNGGKITIKDENGNDIDVDIIANGPSQDAIAKLVGDAIRATGSVAEAIQQVIEKLQEQEWYQKLSKSNKDSVNKQFTDIVKDSAGELITMVDGKLKIPSQMIRNAVESGLKDIDSLTSDIHKKVLEDFPEATERDVRDAITGHGREMSKTKTELQGTIESINRLGKLKSKLEDLRQGRVISKVRKGVRRVSEEEAFLKNEIKTIEDSLKEILSKTDGEKKLESLENELDKLRFRDVKETKDKPKYTEAEQKLIDELKDKIYDEKAKLGLIPSKQKTLPKTDGEKADTQIESNKKRTEKAIKDLEERIAKGDYSKRERKKGIEDNNLIKLRAKKEKLQDEVAEQQYRNELANRTNLKKGVDFVLDILNSLMRQAVAGLLDFGAVTVQGSRRLFKNPVEAKNAFAKSISHFASSKKSEDFINNIKAQDWYPLLKIAKVKLIEDSWRQNVQSEQPAGKILGQLWGLPAALAKKVLGENAFSSSWVKANPYKATQRAYDGYVNYIRVQAFLKGLDNINAQGYDIKNDSERLKALGEYINTQTGSASLGKLEPASPLFNFLVFSVKNQIAALKLMNPVYYAKLPSGVRKRAILETMKGFSALATAQLLAQIILLEAQSDDDEDPLKGGIDPSSENFLLQQSLDEFFDPSSSNFWSIKVRGEDGNFTTLHYWGAIKSWINAFSRYSTGTFTDAGTGVESYLGERYGQNINSRNDVIANKLLNIASPAVGAIHELGGQVKGQEVDYSDFALGLITPMQFQDIKSLYKTHPEVVASFLEMAAILGTSTIVYRLSEEKKELRANKIEESEQNRLNHEMYLEEMNEKMEERKMEKEAQ